MVEHTCSVPHFHSLAKFGPECLQTFVSYMPGVKVPVKCEWKRDMCVGERVQT